MTVTELLETVRRVEGRTNRLVNDTMVGAYLSHFKGRGMDFEELREYSAEKPVSRDSNPIEFEGFGNYGEFAIVKRQTAGLVLIPSNSTGLEFRPTFLTRGDA